MRELPWCVDVEMNLLKKLHVEVAVYEEFAQPTVDGTIKGVRSGEIVAGKIFIINLDECIRIRTGETGQTAIGQDLYELYERSLPKE